MFSDNLPTIAVSDISEHMQTKLDNGLTAHIKCLVPMVLVEVTLEKT